jgi:HK97 family phage portal protein
MGLWSRFLGGPDIAAQDRYIDDWLRGMERGLVSATGIRVTVQEALTSPGIAACIQVQSEDLAKVPLLLKRRTDEGHEPAVEHPLFRLLKFGPSPWLSSYRWRKAMVHAAMAHGNHYSRAWRAETGIIEKITPIQTGRCGVRWAADGEPFFDVTSPTGIERGLSWQDIIHVAYRDSMDGADHGGIIGTSPIMQNKETVALMLAAERFAAAFFGNGAQPSMILEYDKKLPSDEVAARIRSGIERVYGGIDNKWKVAILELGMKMRETSFDPAKSQLTETRKLGAEMACTMYRTPPHKIGLLERATNNNIEHQSIDYVTGPLSTQAQSVDQALTVTCLTPQERELYKIEHNLEGLMRGDILSRYRAYAIGRQWGWLSVNKILERENENTIGPEGDEHLVPMNMVPAGEQADTSAEGWLPSDVRWSAPAAFKSVTPHQARRRVSSIVGPAGERFYLN